MKVVALRMRYNILRGEDPRTGGVLASLNQAGLDHLLSTNEHIPDFDLTRQHPTDMSGRL